jgi:hypothetical protein
MAKNCKSRLQNNRFWNRLIFIKRKFEVAFAAWIGKKSKNLALCCRRRELYCHEVCHLVAIIRAFPSDCYAKARENFIEKIKNKFAKSLNDAENSISIPLISAKNPDDSPSVFDKCHFRYEDDDLNYFRLYEELMLNHELMRNALLKICGSGKNDISLEDVSRETLVPVSFFMIFPERITALRDILASECN